MTEVGGQVAAHPSWDLVARDATVLGRLVLQGDGADMFWLDCTFAPTPAFSAIAPLFVETRRRLERDEMEELESAYEQIGALGLELHPVGGGVPIREFLLHIDGEQARVRF